MKNYTGGFNVLQYHVGQKQFWSLQLISPSPCSSLDQQGVQGSVEVLEQPNPIFKMTLHQAMGGLKL